MTSFATSKNSDDAFLESAQGVVRGVRRALADLLASVGADPSEPQEISRKFGLDKTLTWKVARVVREHDPSDAVGHIPRRPSFQLLVTALQKHGATEERIAALWSAVDAFERFVQLHSDDRETLEIMVGTPRASVNAKRFEAFRRSAYQANSAIWGVRAKMQLSLHFVAPDLQRPGFLSMATVAGLVDFRRLRTDVPWTIAKFSQWQDAGQAPARQGEHLPMDPKLNTNDPPILHDFSTTPLPPMRNVPVHGGGIRFEMTQGSVGNTASATVVLGWLDLGVATSEESFPGECGEHGVFLSTPVESVTHDVLIHKSMTYAMDVSAHLYSELPGGPKYPDDGGGIVELPFHEKVQDLGSGPPDLITPEVPRYREMAEKAAASLGYPLDEFRGYRLRLNYPPIPTLAIIRHGLAKRQG